MTQLLELFRAEWIKIVGHRRATGLLLWIFPVTALVVEVLFAIVAKLDPKSQATALKLFGSWPDLMLLAWTVLGDPFGRVLLMGFTALIFAGEYQWGTWKNIAPRRRRSALILTKLAVLCGLVITAFTALSVILLAGGALVTWTADTSLKPAFTLSALVDFLPDYLLAAALAFVAFLITAILAALAAIYSRSILGGTLVGILLLFVEPILMIVPRWLASAFETPTFLHLVRLLPAYNIENIKAWATSEQATAMLHQVYQSFQASPPNDSLGFSVLVMAAWVVLGIAAVLLVFERQDITS